MNEFKVLPTDERFMNLFEEQKIALFEGINSLPESKILKKNIMMERKIKEIEDRKDEEFISRGLRKTMTAHMRMNGLSEEEINNHIQKIITAKKKTEIKKIEEMRRG